MIPCRIIVKITNILFVIKNCNNYIQGVIELKKRQSFYSVSVSVLVIALMMGLFSGCGSDKQTSKTAAIRLSRRKIFMMKLQPRWVGIEWR